MEFLKERCFTALNADELRAGDKVCVADTLMGLENRVRHECVAELEEVLPDYNEHRFKAYLGIHNLAYLVERKENCTNCGGRITCIRQKPEHPELTKCCNYKHYECPKYKPKTEQKHYRPFKDTDELIKVWCDKGGKWQKRELNMPYIWVLEKRSNAKILITGFAGLLRIDDELRDLTSLFNDYTFLDGSPCGVEE